MMNLIERSERLTADVAEIKTLRGVADQAEAVRSRASQFENALAHLRLSRSTARLLQNRGINVEFGLEAQGLRHFLHELQSKVANDPASILQEKDIKPKILSPIEKAASTIQEAANRAWSAYVRQELPRVGNEFLDALSRIPGLHPKVEAFRNLRSQAQNRGERAPRNNADFDHIQELCRQCRIAWEELRAEDVPHDVLALFREAATSSGASLSSLTPSVFAWLKERGLEGTLGIYVSEH